MTKTLLDILKERNFFYQCTNEKTLTNLLLNKKIVAYIGFDCTAPTLHIGSLIQIMLIRHLLNDGHKVIVLFGGATTRIGDPSGKDKSRKYISIQEIEKNLNGISSTIKKFIPKNTQNIKYVNNLDWFQDIQYIDWLRDIGKLFSINRMLDFESVKTRLQNGQNLSFLEFNYMLMQAYDFIELNKKYNCTLQLGGSDQWGNIVNGIELGRKKLGIELFGLTTPLATNSEGKKMGKTSSGAIWLDENLFSPSDYWQYFRNTDDKDVIQFLKWFTDIDINTTEELSKLKGKEINQAKKILATEATKICHGTEIASNISESFAKEFEQNISDDLPVLNIDEHEISLINLLTKINLTRSNKEAKQKIRSSAVKIDDNVISDIQYKYNGRHKLSIGKKRIIIQTK